MRFRDCISIALALIAAAAFRIPAARAEGRLYLDVGGGLAFIRQSQALLRSSASDLGSGAAFHLAIIGNLSRPTASTLPQFGLMHRIATGSDSAASYGLQSTYPVFRLESQKLFLTLGATPFVFRGIGSAFGLDWVRGAYGFLGELGFHYPITPEISFGASGAAQTVLMSGNLSPRPTLEFSAFMRLFFGRGERAATDEDRDMGPYHGWRYPYGRELR
jgi:hypothetical protein